MSGKPRWTPNWTAATGLAEPKPAYVRVFEYPRGYRGNFFSQRPAKLVYPMRGLASVYTDQGCWLATPLRGVIIPSWQKHRVAAVGNALLHSVFVDPQVYPRCLTEFGMIAVTPLLHELIKEAGKYFVDYPQNSLAQRLLELIVELLQTSGEGMNEQCLPTVRNPRIQKALFGDKSEYKSNVLRSAEIARRAAYSPRQFARVFKADTGMAFKDWRALYQVQESLKLLHQGQSVTAVAEELGFSSASAFISVFRRHLGMTPAQVVQRQGAV